MNYRRLGKTELMVSEVGLGGEWLEKHNTEEVAEVIHKCEEEGINIMDCWMCEPNVRTNIGKAIAGHRDKWFIQGPLGSVWRNGQSDRTRELSAVKEAFNDLLERLQTDYIDLGMIFFCDTEKDYEEIVGTEYIDYVKELHKNGTIRHVGMSTHNPRIAKRAILDGLVEMILFSVNPAFDMIQPSENIDILFEEELQMNGTGIDPERAELYRLCEEYDIGITVMKGFAGGRLFKEEASPFGVALTPEQCIHYALTRPAVASVLCGLETTEQVEAAVKYETATDEEKDYATVLANAPKHGYKGQCTYCGHCKPCPMDIDIAMVNKYYDLATMQPEVPDSLKAHYQALLHHADECIGCGACEARCPFSVKVSERMQKAAELFG